jgi:hypothetical protein
MRVLRRLQVTLNVQPNPTLVSYLLSLTQCSNAHAHAHAHAHA